MVVWQSMGGVVVPAGAALATPADSVHAEAHGAITVCRDRLRRMGVPAIGAATATPQVLTTRLQNQESRVTKKPRFLIQDLQSIFLHLY